MSSPCLNLKSLLYQVYSQENIATSKEEGRHLVESEITFIPSIKQTWLIRNKNVVSLFESEITIVPIVLRSKCDLIQTRMSSYWTKQPNKSWFGVDRVYTQEDCSSQTWTWTPKYLWDEARESLICHHFWLPGHGPGLCWAFTQRSNQ